MLTGLHLQNEVAISKLTLDAPRLLKIKHFGYFSLNLDRVHGESVEWLLIHDQANIEMKKLKNLKYLYCCYFEFDLTLLSNLKQLKEIHLRDHT